MCLPLPRRCRTDYGVRPHGNLENHGREWPLRAAHARGAEEARRVQRAGQKKPVEFNGVAEYTPPYGFTTQCQAELFWSTEDAWEEIMRRARARARPEW